MALVSAWGKLAHYVVEIEVRGPLPHWVLFEGLEPLPGALHLALSETEGSGFSDVGSQDAENIPQIWTPQPCAARPGRSRVPTGLPRVLPKGRDSRSPDSAWQVAELHGTL